MVAELWPHHEGTPSFCGSSTDNSLLDQILTDTTCSHAHACSPPGPDLVHTHTCYHAHTQVFTQGDNEIEKEQATMTKPGKSLGNKEAVRKYRKKKKAHIAYLEEEVKQLRALNQQLIRKLQSRSVLEAEVVRLKTLLLELKGRIDNEVGALPFKRTCRESLKEGGCSPQFGKFNAEGNTIAGGQRERICKPVAANCVVNANGNVGVPHDQMISGSFCD